MTLAPWLVAAALSAANSPMTDASSADQGYSYSPTEDVIPQLVERKSELPDISLVLRGGMLSGNGTVALSCSGIDCGAPLAFTEAPSFALDAALVFPVGKLFRMGVGAGVVPSMKVAFENGTNADLGTLGSFGVPLELVIPMSGKLALTIHADVNMLVLSGGELADEAERYATMCPGCDVTKAPFFGYAASAGAGVRWDAGPVALRADFALQSYRIQGYSFDTGDSSASLELWGTRGYALAGVEL